MKTQWEYVVLKLTVDVSFFSRTDFDPATLHDELNARGAEGWELVSVFDIERFKGGSKFVMAVMKRPKP